MSILDSIMKWQIILISSGIQQCSMLQQPLHHLLMSMTTSFMLKIDLNKVYCYSCLHYKKVSRSPRHCTRKGSRNQNLNLLHLYSAFQPRLLQVVLEANQFFVISDGVST